MTARRTQLRTDNPLMRYYFAYGSNMLSARLRARIGEVPGGAAASTGGYQLKFHKRGGDGSAKCDAYDTGDPRHMMHGVVYQITNQQKTALDRFEGAGYRVTELTVAVNGSQADVFMYVAEQQYIDSHLLPYHWYKQFVLAGAYTWRLPDWYVRAIAEVPANLDPDPRRHQRNALVLAEARALVPFAQ